MATRTQVLNAIALAAGVKVMTLERVFRELADMGVVPKGSPGRGNAVHWHAPHLATVLLALASVPLPSDAPKFIQALQLLVAEISDARGHVVTLFGWVMNRVISFADPAERTKARAVPAIEQIELLVLLHPYAAFGYLPWPDDTNLLARMDRNNHFSNRQSIAFYPQSELINTPSPALQRSCTIKQELFLVAGELLQDTIARLSVAPSISPSGLPSTTGSGSESAGPLPQEPAPSNRQSDKAPKPKRTPRKTGPSSSPEYAACVCPSANAESDGGLAFPQSPSWRTPHGRRLEPSRASA